jgi:SAM-dependent methyltransferase
VAGKAITVNYPEGGLAALGLDGGAGYWFDHRADAVIDALTSATGARSIWDIGAGTGAMSLRLARAGFDVVAVEPLSDGARAIAAQGSGAVFCSSLEALLLPDGCLPIVGLFDVIEHLDDPAALMTEVRRVLEPSGVVAITVPAFQSLWSNVDVVAGHRRRYTRTRLDRFMRQCGFDPITTEYIFASLLLPSAMMRTLPYRLGRRPSAEAVIAIASKELEPSPIVDNAARAILRMEKAISRRIRLPGGLTVLGVFRVNPSDGRSRVP